MANWVRATVEWMLTQHTFTTVVSDWFNGKGQNKWPSKNNSKYPKLKTHLANHYLLKLSNRFQYEAEECPQTLTGVGVKWVKGYDEPYSLDIKLTGAMHPESVVPEKVTWPSASSVCFGFRAEHCNRAGKSANPWHLASCGVYSTKDWSWQIRPSCSCPDLFVWRKKKSFSLKKKIPKVNSNHYLPSQTRNKKKSLPCSHFSCFSFKIPVFI